MAWKQYLEDIAAQTLSYMEKASKTDADMAWALLSLGRHGELPPEFARDEEGTRVLGALAWWLFIRAPCMALDQFLLAGFNLDLVISSDRTIAQVLDDLKALEDMTEHRTFDAPDWLDSFLDAGWDQKVLLLPDDQWIPQIKATLAMLGEHEDDLRDILASHMKSLLEQFDTTHLRADADPAGVHEEEEQPSSAEGWMYKGHHHYEAGDLESARECYDQALKQDPELFEAHQSRAITRAALEDLDGALQDFDALYAANPRDLITLTNRALVLHSLERSAEALVDLTRALELAGDDPELLINRGIARFAIGELGPAKTDFDQAIRLDPKQPVAYLQRGNLFRLRAELGHALSDYAQVIKLAPDHPDVYSARGFVFLELDELPKAIADFDRAIKLQPADPLNYFNRAHAHGMKEDWAAAIADYDRAIELDPHDPHAYVNRGSARVLKGDLDEALQDWEVAIALDPTYPTPYVKRASMWIAAGELESAALDLSTALEHADKDWPPRLQVQSMLDDILKDLGFDPAD